jgi:putative transposase
VVYNPDKHHRRSIRLKGYDYSASGTYFITICAYQREEMFGAIVDGTIALNEFGGIVAKYWRWLSTQYPYVTLDEWVVMPNHLHGILVVNDISRVESAMTDTSRTELKVPDISQMESAMTDTSRVELEVSDTSRRGGSRTAPTNHGCDTPTSNHGCDTPTSNHGCDTPTSNHGCDTPISNPCCDPPTMLNHDRKRKPLGRLIGAFKTVSAKEINQIRNAPNTPIWQRNYYEHIVRDRTSLQYIRDYIRHNPCSWKEDQLHPDNPSKW